ncbi:MAG TPA: hypothetical protein VHF58_07325 [Solirubrobacterales bacterium]|nr:hypothetical protein [Solirubrobacterales bacterium]
MHRSWVAGGLLAIAMAIAALGASNASAFDGALSPQIPGIGNASGMDGPPPQVEVHGGRSGVSRSGSTWVEVSCTTSTGTGCAGTLELAAGGNVVGFAPFELAERQSQGVHTRLSRLARRKAGRRTGVKLVAHACAADSLGRTACDTATLTVRSAR